MRLTLESQVVQKATAPYLESLAPVVDGRKDVVGFVYVVNGMISGAEAYGSHGLFTKLWPKLVEASAVEAVAGQDAGSHAPLDIEAVRRFLAGLETANTTQRGSAGRAQRVVQENNDGILFETREANQPQVWIHRTYLRK